MGNAESWLRRESNRRPFVRVNRCVYFCDLPVNIEHNLLVSSSDLVQSDCKNNLLPYIDVRGHSWSCSLSA